MNFFASYCFCVIHSFLHGCSTVVWYYLPIFRLDPFCSIGTMFMKIWNSTKYILETAKGTVVVLFSPNMKIPPTKMDAHMPPRPWTIAEWVCGKTSSCLFYDILILLQFHSLFMRNVPFICTKLFISVLEKIRNWKSQFRLNQTFQMISFLWLFNSVF